MDRREYDLEDIGMGGDQGDDRDDCIEGDLTALFSFWESAAPDGGYTLDTYDIG